MEDDDAGMEHVETGTFASSFLRTAKLPKLGFDFQIFFIEKITFRHKASSDLMSDGRSEEIDIQRGRHGTWQSSK